MRRKKRQDKSIPSWNKCLRQIAVLRGAKDSPHTILERLKIKDYNKRIGTDWGERIAIFSSYESARAYLQWSTLDEKDESGSRYSSKSLLYGYNRAWVTSMWVDVPVDPKIK